MILIRTIRDESNSRGFHCFKICKYRSIFSASADYVNYNLNLYYQCNMDKTASCFIK